MVLFMIPMGAKHDKTNDYGLVLADHYLFGSVVATILVIVVTAQVALDTSYWTVWNHITIWGSLIFYFSLTFFYNYVVKGKHIGSLATAMADTTFWFTTLLTTVVLLLPVVAWRFYKVDVHPTLTDKAKLVQRNARIRSRGVSGLSRPFSGRRSRRSVRSGYAFSHTEGFGRLTTSGRIMRDIGGAVGTGRGKVHNGMPAPRPYNNNSNAIGKTSSSILPHTLTKSKQAFLPSSKTSTALSPPQPQESQLKDYNVTDYPGVPLED